MDSFNSPRTRPLYRGTQAVWYVLGVLEALLIIRFLLKLLGANAGAGFTDFIYTLSGVFLSPFLSVFPIERIEGSVFEWPTILAMVVYWLVAWGIVKLFLIAKPVSTPEAAVKLEQQDQ